MSKKIKAKIINGALVPLEPLGIEEGANVVFELIAKAPPGVEPSMRDYVSALETKLPSEIDEELFVKECLENERRTEESNRREFRMTPHDGVFLPGVDPYNLKKILNDEDDEHHLRLQDKAE